MAVRWKDLALTLRDVLTARGQDPSPDMLERVTRALKLIEHCEADDWDEQRDGKKS